MYNLPSIFDLNMSWQCVVGGSIKILWSRLQSQLAATCFSLGRTVIQVLGLLYFSTKTV
jgi:hypothetical protein